MMGIQARCFAGLEDKNDFRKNSETLWRKSVAQFCPNLFLPIAVQVFLHKSFGLLPKIYAFPCERQFQYAFERNLDGMGTKLNLVADHILTIAPKAQK